MGMFDYVEFSTQCPTCGLELNDFQSKDHDCLLMNIPYTSVSNFYTMCLNCKTWVEYNKISEAGGIEGYERTVNAPSLLEKEKE